MTKVSWYCTVFSSFIDIGCSELHEWISLYKCYEVYMYLSHKIRYKVIRSEGIRLGGFWWRGVTIVGATASHQCEPGSIDLLLWMASWVVKLFWFTDGFSSGSPVSIRPSKKKKKLQIPIRPGEGTQIKTKGWHGLLSIFSKLHIFLFLLSSGRCLQRNHKAISCGRK